MDRVTGMPWQDQKRFMDEMILRFEKAFRRVDDSFAKHVEENTAELRRLRGEAEAHRKKWEAHRKDYLAESRAHRKALLHVLDELKGRRGEGPAPA
jgi:hypothetical protein